MAYMQKRRAEAMGTLWDNVRVSVDRFIASTAGQAAAAAAYTDDTQCSSIPAGNPYRSPGHWCMYNGQMLQFDDDGNVHPEPGAPGTPGAPDPNPKPSDMATYLAIGVGVAVGLIVLNKKKRRRR